MNKIMTPFVIAICFSFSTPVFADKDPNLDLIKARQGAMQLRSFYLGPLVAMAKGKLPYDAKMAGELAASLDVLLKLDTARAWAKGTDNKKYAGKTHAMPAIWTNYADVAEHGKQYAAAVKVLATAAGTDVNALRAAVGDVGKACKSCHDDFVEKK